VQKYKKCAKISEKAKF